MNGNKKLNEKEIQEMIRKVDGAMAREGMSLTKELKHKLYNCIIGESLIGIERRKVIEKYRGIYGQYIYERTVDYCYKGSAVLINKLNGVSIDI